MKVINASKLVEFKKKGAIIINALSPKYIKQFGNIKNSYKIYYKSLKIQTNEGKNDAFKFIKKKIGFLPKKNDIIICYCAHEKCIAGVTLCKYFSKLGYKNVMDYKKGLKDWKNKKNKNKFQLD